MTIPGKNYRRVYCGACRECNLGGYHLELVPARGACWCGRPLALRINGKRGPLTVCERHANNKARARAVRREEIKAQIRAELAAVPVAVGSRVGLLTVVEIVGSLLVCRCDCGGERRVYLSKFHQARACACRGSTPTRSGPGDAAGLVYRKGIDPRHGNRKGGV